MRIAFTIMYETVVLRRQGDNQLVESSVDVTSHCECRSGSFACLCNSLISLWEPDQLENVKYNVRSLVLLLSKIQLTKILETVTMNKTTYT